MIPRNNHETVTTPRQKLLPELEMLFSGPSSIAGDAADAADAADASIASIAADGFAKHRKP